MQRIEVNVRRSGNNVSFEIGNKEIARICEDIIYPGRYTGRFGTFGTITNAELIDACDFIGNEIERHFSLFGLGVSFLHD